MSTLGEAFCEFTDDDALAAIIRGALLNFCNDAHYDVGLHCYYSLRYRCCTRTLFLGFFQKITADTQRNELLYKSFRLQVLHNWR